MRDAALPSREKKASDAADRKAEDRRLVRSVVIHNGMDMDIGGRIGLDGVEKLPEFLRAVAPM